MIVLFSIQTRRTHMMHQMFILENSVCHRAQRRTRTAYRIRKTKRGRDNPLNRKRLFRELMDKEQSIRALETERVERSIQCYDSVLMALQQQTALEGSNLPATRTSDQPSLMLVE